MPDRLTVADVGCWVIKSQRSPSVVDPGWSPGTSRSLSRCLRRTYRVELMSPGQLCLLWVSGRHQPGVHAIGTLTSDAAAPVETGEGAPEVAVAVSLTRLEQPVERSALLSDHVLAGAEVLRMPAGSNPSYLSRERLDALLDLLVPDDVRRAGWVTARSGDGMPAARRPAARSR